MARREHSKRALKQLRSSYLSSVISTSLVLFLLGFTGLFLLNAKRISSYFKENVGLSIYLNENLKEADVTRFRKQLDAADYVRETRYISKEDAAEDYKKNLGDDFAPFLKFNPLPASIEAKLQPLYANSDSITVLQHMLERNPMVDEVSYQKNLLDLVNHNIERISIIMLLFSALLLFVSIVLINNTIRLSVYSKRFLINTMKLIGATHGFIIKPFVSRSIIQGFIAGAVATTMLSGLIYILYKEFNDILEFTDANILLIVFASMIAMGIIITLLATYFSVQRFVRLNSDDLYY